MPVPVCPESSLSQRVPTCRFLFSGVAPQVLWSLVRHRRVRHPDRAEVVTSHSISQPGSPWDHLVTLSVVCCCCDWETERLWDCVTTLCVRTPRSLEPLWSVCLSPSLSPPAPQNSRYPEPRTRETERNREADCTVGLDPPRHRPGP